MLTQPLRTACVVLLVLPAALAAAPPAQARSGAAPVPVQVCNQSQDWRRPGPEDMARTVWRDGRYVNFSTGTVGDRILAYYTHHFFFLTSPTLNGVGKLLAWSGLDTARVMGCGGDYDPALIEGGEVAIWVVGYRIAAADVTGSTLTLTVEPNSPALDRGYAIVKAPRPGGLWYAASPCPTGARWRGRRRRTRSAASTSRRPTPPCRLRSRDRPTAWPCPTARVASRSRRSPATSA
jgi:hypothetical protein